MRRIRLFIAYDGSAYVGWQAQPNGVSVEEVLTGALKKLLKENVLLIGASRTDSGVHADGNIAVFDTESRIPGDKFKFALNEFLPRDIVVQESDEVPLTYHPRKVNAEKTYEYRILNRKIPLPKERNYAYFYYYPLDVQKMDRAAKVLLGEHDFKSFCAPRTQIEDTVRRIYDISVEKEGDIITLRVRGNGFLYHMVRIIAGTLVKIGAGLLPEEEMIKILEARDRSAAGPMAPPEGLTLKEIKEEKSLPPYVEEENPHWGYRLYQDRTETEKTAFLILDHVDAADYDRTLLRLTKTLSRNGAVFIYVLDRTGRLTAGMREDYFTYLDPEEESGEAQPPGLPVDPGFPEKGRWFLTFDKRKLTEDTEDPLEEEEDEA
ncbi:MAG: tRNA pseudouridine(38-40) synthase TruA [Lachnospiraceae bacterium]|nr:tRNA pseudouridine(38-40) synthase TruA [Lachnospiraceae bacterium]